METHWHAGDVGGQRLEVLHGVRVGQERCVDDQMRDAQQAQKATESQTEHHVFTAGGHILPDC